MSSTDKVFSGSIPAFYDTYMVPLIFQTYADDLALRAEALRPSAVLETAAGSGVVPRALARRLPERARYVITDLNQAMLDHAASHQPQPERLEWRQADALDLPFDAGSFDLVLCQFGAMFFPDRPKGYAEARRVLRPGGHYLFSTWDRIEANELADSVTQTMARVFPQDPPRFLARTPHGYHDADQIRADVAAAAFSRIAITHIPAESLVQSAQTAAMAYCQGTPLRNELEARAPDRLQELTDIATAALEERFGKGAIRSKIAAYVITAEK
jgi:ubiquinone/menaquinone biosynthesis C-methylase UbiE